MVVKLMPKWYRLRIDGHDYNRLETLWVGLFFFGGCQRWTALFHALDVIFHCCLGYFYGFLLVTCLNLSGFMEDVNGDVPLFLALMVSMASGAQGGGCRHCRVVVFILKKLFGFIALGCVGLFTLGLYNIICYLQMIAMYIYDLCILYNYFHISFANRKFNNLFFWLKCLKKFKILAFYQF